MYQPKILLIDLETSMATGRFFGKTYETNILSILEHAYVLSFAYCWYPDRKVKVVSLPDFKGYKKGSDCEEKLLKALWKLVDEADLVVAQNGRAFDTKFMNMRFAFYRMTPPSPYEQVDTLQGLRRAFNLPSNKLDYACEYFGIGNKLPHTGKDLWGACMGGDRQAWKLMCRYNANDVYPLLYDLYKLLIPWSKHPNLNLVDGRPHGCPFCRSMNFVKGGHRYLLGYQKQRYSCNNCGSWFYGEKEKLDNRVVHVPR